MDQTLTTMLAAAVPTLAVIIAIVRNESSTALLTSRMNGIETNLSNRITSLENRLDMRITSLENRMDARFETLDRDLREWARITMTHDADIARLKDKTGLG
jgi:hypothetical protein